MADTDSESAPSITESERRRAFAEQSNRPRRWPDIAHGHEARARRQLSFGDVLDRVSGPRRDFRELDVVWDHERETIWCYMRPSGTPSFTPGMLGELIDLRRSIQALARDVGGSRTVRYFVGGSHLPGIYNLGGDLHHFVRLIRARDAQALRRYAYDCVDVSYYMNQSLACDVATIALVQGDALGGGFEGALSFNFLVAERNATFGLPEILFNLFPGMGAHSFLARRLGMGKALRIITGGQCFDAEEMHRQGIVDLLAEEGEGAAAVEALIQEDASRRRRGLASRLRRPERLVPFEELRDATDIWVEAALNLGDSDLRKMERLVSAQERRVRRVSSPPAEAQAHRAPERARAAETG